MLPITTKMQRLDIEITEVIGYLKDVQSILIVTAQGREPLKSLEPYLSYKLSKKNFLLFDDVVYISDFICKVYKGKMSSSQALQKIEKAIKELLIIRGGIFKMEDERKNCRE